MRKRSWTEKQLRTYTAKSTSYRQVLHKLKLVEAGGNYSQIKKYIQEYDISVEHFTGRAWNKGKKYPYKSKLSLEEVLMEDSDVQSYKLKKRLFLEGVKKVACELCGWHEHAPDGRIPLELDHINGNRKDNRLKNLRILCPNCHSLQSTNRGLNRKKKVTT